MIVKHTPSWSDTPASVFCICGGGDNVSSNIAVTRLSSQSNGLEGVWYNPENRREILISSYANYGASIILLSNVPPTIESVSNEDAATLLETWPELAIG